MERPDIKSTITSIIFLAGDSPLTCEQCSNQVKRLRSIYDYTDKFNREDIKASLSHMLKGPIDNDCTSCCRMHQGVESLKSRI